MTQYTQLLPFVQAHLNDDPTKLLLSARRYPDVDMPWVVDQIEARNRLRTKLPEWYECPELIMSGRIPSEQCSSEATARYKQSLVRGSSLADLTGGMGVDCYYMSQGLERATYIERQPALCAAARHNFAALGASHITVVNGDGRDVLPVADTLYLDPARRATDGSRVYDLADCEPNVVELLPTLMAHCQRLVVKISPMADLTRVLQIVPGIAEIHVLAVKGECKEVVLVVDAGSQPADVHITCVDFVANASPRTFSYSLSEEHQAVVNYADSCGPYLYEPDVTLLKAGAFKLPAQRYGLAKLDVNSHCYTSAELVPDFPGRIFRITDDQPFASRTLRSLRKQYPQCNITARNFPLTADQLRAKMGLRDGGEQYLIATTVRSQGARLLFGCKALLFVVLLLCMQFLVAMLGGSLTPSAYAQQAPCRWLQGMPFVCLNTNPDVRLVAESDTTQVPLLGSQWTFHSLIAEENWLGQMSVCLRFQSPDGKFYRFDTGRGEEILQDTTYHPVLPMLYPMQPILDTDAALRGHTRYLLINDETIQPEGNTSVDSLRQKYVEVHIDSVTYGTELAPLRVWISRGTSRASVCSSLPDSREASLSRSLDRVFMDGDPHRRYPMITDEHWALICRSQVCIDMTLEEVRLAWGRPLSVDRSPSRAGLVETLTFLNGRVVLMLDGRVVRIGKK